MTDPSLKQHFTASMGWIRLVIDTAIESGDRDFAEQISREINGQHVRIANAFGFQRRTGMVHKVENIRKVGGL